MDAGELLVRRVQGRDGADMTLPEPVIKVEYEDGSGGDLPGWYVRRYALMPIKAPAGGGISIAGPFGSKPAAERWLRLRLLEHGSLERMLPIPPAALMAKQPDPDAEVGVP